MTTTKSDYIPRSMRKAGKTIGAVTKNVKMPGITDGSMGPLKMSKKMLKEKKRIMQYHETRGTF